MVDEARWTEELARMQEEQRQESAALAASIRATFPALTGTPKQVSWASDIREKALAGWVRSREGVETSPATHEAAARVFAQAQAKFWIDNRGTSVTSLALNLAGK